jgi:hypothetical protein
LVDNTIPFPNNCTYAVFNFTGDYTFNAELSAGLDCDLTANDNDISNIKRMFFFMIFIFQTRQYFNGKHNLHHRKKLAEALEKGHHRTFCRLWI